MKEHCLDEVWSENLWVEHDGYVPLIGKAVTGGEIATAFVVKDVLGRELDIHAIRFDEHGCGTPAWNSTMSFPPDAFQGHGLILGSPVRCLSAAMQMQTHTGYTLQEKDIQELRLLHERFGLDYPEEHAHLRANRPSDMADSSTLSARGRA